MKSSSRLTNFTNYESITDSFIDEHCRNNRSSADQRSLGKFNFKRSFSCQYLTRALHELCEDPGRAQRNFTKPSASEIHNCQAPLPTPVSSSHYHSTDNQLRTESSEVFVKGTKRSRILQTPTVVENFDDRRPPLSPSVGMKTSNDQSNNSRWALPGVPPAQSTPAQFDRLLCKKGKQTNGTYELEETRDQKNSYDTGIDIVPENASLEYYDHSNNSNGDRRETEELHEFSMVSLRDLRQIFETVDSIMEAAREKVDTEFAYPWSDPPPKNEKEGRNEFASPILSFEKHDRYVQVYRFEEVQGAEDAEETSTEKRSKMLLKSLKRYMEEGIRTLIIVALSMLYFLVVIYFHFYLIEQREEFWESVEGKGDHRVDQ
ncbi:hypothetical protein GE061_009648 [Apolygus lucorum]|uniref:Uncharacterized protein n=1 Tax=Apolygus lucorum TaxID=248454 RepID=A0A6A4K762_APOLU|nr:hypothetical protein GE061_009648 [Apolygus lucorum]